MSLAREVMPLPGRRSFGIHEAVTAGVSHRAVYEAARWDFNAKSKPPLAVRKRRFFDGSRY